MASKKGLGKGLSALITENINEDSVNVSKDKIIVLDINRVEPNRDQPRKKFDEDTLNELSESIKQYGIIQPILVQKENDYYSIIAGERRWRASKLAGLKEVPVIIKGYNKQEILEISLIENIQRENLNPIEEAKAYKKLIYDFNLKQDDLADKVSKSRSAISNVLRLLNLDERVQDMIMDDMLSSGHCRTLLSIENKDVQFDIANKIFDEKLSVRETEKLVKELKKPKKEEKNIKKEDPVYKEIEEKMKEVLGTKVRIIKKSNKKGKIEIEYYSQEELENIIDIIGERN
ncbi:ParB family chromosome partitioning protein [Natranaerovirga hydrolytica]|uniref:ParB family chromosome partitioning protein n=1 Tax=Natranaerovirga hydrolytica TaxID=680378 RepID=A0A4R1M4N0_9FIRM|nr:ParB/RepB/Spo0J family partition protein [Natranaerovirga hydrolytica]TCK86775.1 ParB family chromosome partitioning protein [Natranaerovirga hydrolytica]